MQEGWCDSVGSVQEIQAKLLKRQEAAAKRERAMAYALAHQVTHVNCLVEFYEAAFFFILLLNLIVNCNKRKIERKEEILTKI